MVGQIAQTDEMTSLYRRAFDEFGASALSRSRAVENPNREDAPAITRSLRVEGDLRARQLAEQIERACSRGNFIHLSR